jgi:hypothetical protein
MDRIEIFEKLHDFLSTDTPKRTQEDEVDADTSPLSAYDMGFEDGSTSDFIDTDEEKLNKIADWIVDTFQQKAKS